MIKFKQVSLVLLLFSFTNNLYADQTAALMACASITNDAERLACFDKIVGKRTVSKGVYREAEQANNLSKQTHQFGQEHIEEQKSAQAVDFVINSLEKSASKRWIITFENGQIWQQQDTEYLSLSAGDSVKLSKGVFGAIFLQKNGSNRKIKVRRQK